MTGPVDPGRTAGVRRCKKQRYPTWAAANAVLLDARIACALGNRRRREARIYPCRHCEGWHLTSQPVRRETTS